MKSDDKIASVFLSIRGGLARAVSGIVPPREIEDVVQETYVRACQSGTADEIRSPRSFMFRTARNIALNYVNRAESRLSDSLDVIDDVSELALSNGDTLSIVCSNEEFALFCDAVRQLPLQCRRVFVLQKVYGHSYREVAEILQISEKTVEKHVSMGLTRCRTYLLARVDRPIGVRKTAQEVGHEQY